MKYARSRITKIGIVLIALFLTATLSVIFSFFFTKDVYGKPPASLRLSETKADAPTPPQIDAETDFGGSSLTTFNVIRDDKIILTSASQYDVYYALRLTAASATNAVWYQDESVVWTKLSATDGKYYVPIPHTDQYISFAAITAVSTSSTDPNSSKWSEFSEASGVTTKENLRLTLTGPSLTDDFGNSLNNQSVFTDLYIKVSPKQNEYSFGVKQVEIRSNGKLLDTYLADTDRVHFIRSDGSETGIFTDGYIYIPIPSFGKEELDRIGYGYQPKYQITVTDTVSRFTQIDLSFGLPDVSVVTYLEYFDDSSAVSYTVRARNQLLKYDGSMLPGGMPDFSNCLAGIEAIESKYASLARQVTDFNEFRLPALAAFEKSQINTCVYYIMEAYKLQDSITDENVKKHLDTTRLENYIREYITLAMTDHQITVILPNIDLRDKGMLSYRAEVTRATTELDAYQKYATEFSASLQLKQSYRIRIFLGEQDITAQFKDTVITIKLNTYPDYNLNVMRPVCGISSGSNYLGKEVTIEDQYCVFTVTGLENVIVVGMYASDNAFLRIGLPILLSVIAAVIIVLAIILYRKTSKVHRRKIEEIQSKIDRQKEKNAETKKTDQKAEAKNSAERSEETASETHEKHDTSNSDGQTDKSDTASNLNVKAENASEDKLRQDDPIKSSEQKDAHASQKLAAQHNADSKAPDARATAGKAQSQTERSPKTSQNSTSKKTQTGNAAKNTTASKNASRGSGKTSAKKPNAKK